MNGTLPVRDGVEDAASIAGDDVAGNAMLPTPRHPSFTNAVQRPGVLSKTAPYQQEAAGIAAANTQNINSMPNSKQAST